MYDKKKQDKYLVYNSQHSFAKFKDINEFNELLRDSMYKRLNDFKKRFNRLKIVNPQTNNNKVLKQKVLDDVRDLFNELCYIYKDKYKEEKYGLNARGKKKKKKLTAKNWHLLMIINMNLKKKNNRLVKKNHPENLMKKEPP